MFADILNYMAPSVGLILKIFDKTLNTYK